MAKKKEPQYYLRLLKEMLDKGLTKSQAHSLLAGVGKHARQRKRSKDYEARKKRLKKERKEAHAPYRAKKKGGKKPVRKKRVKANPQPKYRRKK